jgi:hypothetical protein
MAGDINRAAMTSSYDDYYPEEEAEALEHKDKSIVRAEQFSELYGIDEGLVSFVIDPAHYMGSLTTPDDAYPQVVELFLKNDNRLLALALADPNMLPVAEARLGDLEIPNLNVFLNNLVTLDEKAMEFIEANNLAKSTYAWLILKYTDATEQRDRLMFLYRNLANSGGKNSLLPVGYDVPVNDMLQGQIDAEPQKLGISPRTGFTSSSPDTKAEIKFGDKTLVLVIATSNWMSETTIEAFGVADSDSRDIIKEVIRGEFTHNYAKPISHGDFRIGSLSWQRQSLGGGCTSPSYPVWY